MTNLEKLQLALKRIRTVRTCLTKGFNDIVIPDYPHMTEKERNAFIRYLKDAKIYIEYGCGGSTKLAVMNKVPSVTSVENDGEFASALREDLAKYSSEESNVTILHKSLGPSGEWGKPVFTFKTDNYKQRAYNYVSGPWQALSGAVPDLILIDGRFRLASTFHSLQQVPEGREAGTTFFFHDFGNRKNYHALKPYVSIVDEVDTALIFRRNPKISSQDLMRAYQEHKLDWR